MCYVHAYTQRYVHRNHATRPQKTTPDHTIQRYMQADRHTFCASTYKAKIGRRLDQIENGSLQPAVRIRVPRLQIFAWRELDWLHAWDNGSATFQGPSKVKDLRWSLDSWRFTLRIYTYIYIYIDWLLVLLSKDKLGRIWFSRERAVLCRLWIYHLLDFFSAEDASPWGFVAHWQSISWLCAPGTALDRKSYWFLNDEYDVFVTEVKVHYCVTEIHHFADVPILSFCLCTVYCILVLKPFQ